MKLIFTVVFAFTIRTQCAEHENMGHKLSYSFFDKHFSKGWYSGTLMKRIQQDDILSSLLEFDPNANQYAQNLMLGIEDFATHLSEWLLQISLNDSYENELIIKYNDFIEKLIELIPQEKQSKGQDFFQPLAQYLTYTLCRNSMVRRKILYLVTYFTQNPVTQSAYYTISLFGSIQELRKRAHRLKIDYFLSKLILPKRL